MRGLRTAVSPPFTRDIRSYLRFEIEADIRESLGENELAPVEDAERWFSWLLLVGCLCLVRVSTQ
jgi:hypothetical protein